MRKTRKDLLNKVFNFRHGAVGKHDSPHKQRIDQIKFDVKLKKLEEKKARHDQVKSMEKELAEPQSSASDVQRLKDVYHSANVLRGGSHVIQGENHSIHEKQQSPRVKDGVIMIKSQSKPKGPGEQQFNKSHSEMQSFPGGATRQHELNKASKRYNLNEIDPALTQQASQNQGAGRYHASRGFFNTEQEPSAQQDFSAHVSDSRDDDPRHNLIDSSHGGLINQSSGGIHNKLNFLKSGADSTLREGVYASESSNMKIDGTVISSQNGANFQQYYQQRTTTQDGPFGDTDGRFSNISSSLLSPQFNRQEGAPDDMNTDNYKSHHVKAPSGKLQNPEQPGESIRNLPMSQRGQSIISKDGAPQAPPRPVQSKNENLSELPLLNSNMVNQNSSRMFINKSSLKTNEIVSSQTFGGLNYNSQESQLQGSQVPESYQFKGAFQLSNPDLLKSSAKPPQPQIQSKVELPTGYTKKRKLGSNEKYPSLHRQSKQMNNDLHAKSSLNMTMLDTEIKETSLKHLDSALGLSQKPTVPTLNLDLLQKQSTQQLSKMSFREIESETFREAFSTFKQDGLDVRENISELAKLVKEQTRSKYERIKKMKRLQQSMKEEEEQQVQTRSQDKMWTSSTFKNKDLQIIYPNRTALLNFDSQLNRPDFSKLNRCEVHDNRFNYFDSNKVSQLSKNKKGKVVNFDAFLPRKGLHASKSNDYSLTEDEQRALSQSIRYKKSHLNDLPTDVRSCLYQKPKMFVNMEGSGSQLLKRHLLDENDNETFSRKLLSKDFDNDEVRRIKSPDLDTLAAFKKTAAVSKNYVNIDFSRIPSRNARRYQNTQKNKIPAFMHHSGGRHQMQQMTDQGLNMNKFIENSRFIMDTTSEFNRPTQSDVSKQRYKQMLKCRRNQLKQYFPGEFKDDPGFSKSMRENMKLDEEFSLLVDQKQAKNIARNLKKQAESVHVLKKPVKLEDMDFFRLLQATGFVEGNNLTEAKIRRINKMKHGKYGSLPRIKEEKELYEKPWRVQKPIKLNEDFDVVTDSDSG